MIAMLLAAQITAVAVPQGLPLEAILPPRGYITPRIGNGIVRALPAKSCPGAGRMETSFAEPAALYRRGDRPAVMLRKWVDYPEGRYCHVEAAP
jgi:hypothetical protein